MIEQYFPCERVRERLRQRGFGDLFSRFAERLHDRGYAHQAVRNYVWGVEHFLAWLNHRKLGLQDIDRPLVRTFLDQHLPQCDCDKPAPTGLRQVRPAVNHLLRMLCEQGVVGESEPQSLIEAELRKYREHLKSVCGLSESTCVGRVKVAREFMQTQFVHGELQWDALKPDDVISFVRNYAPQYKRSSLQVVASALRTFLRYLQFHGRCEELLIVAVPSIANWRLAQVPKTMTDIQLRSFLESFDRSTVTGRRDYAMALCQVVLGLRVSEVARIRLDDIDWKAGVLRVAAGKNLRSRDLPLTKRVGEAIADYACHGRPRLDCRHIFLRHRAPLGPVSLAVVREAVRQAFRRTEGCEQWKGTHVLRHTAATNMLERGTSLKEISDVLGHRCIETTTIYTKVDVVHLREVALPWPEVTL